MSELKLFKSIVIIIYIIMVGCFCFCTPCSHRLVDVACPPTRSFLTNVADVKTEVKN